MIKTIEMPANPELDLYEALMNWERSIARKEWYAFVAEDCRTNKNKNGRIKKESHQKFLTRAKAYFDGPGAK